MITAEYTYGRPIASPEVLDALKDGCVLALGFFDGVHLAHRELIGAARREADKRGLPLAVFTFGTDGGIKRGVKRIYSDKEKLMLLEQCRADITVLGDFCSLRELSAEEFIDSVLIGELNAKCAVCGFNFRFGKGASGDASLLRERLAASGRDSLIIEEYHFSDKTLSSSLIRSLLSEGRLGEANLALGSPYFIEGSVSHGRGEGHRMGIPTVNSDTPKERLIVPRGVYLTETVIGGRAYPSLTNVGTCPTFGEREVHAETFILDFKGDLYGMTLKIYFLSYLREEKIFENEKELLLQINIDKNKALSLYGDLKWQDNGHN